MENQMKRFITPITVTRMQALKQLHVMLFQYADRKK